MNRTLEVALGLGGAYLFLSVIVLALVEGISGFLNRRGKNLRDALEAMLTKGVAAELIAHPLVQSLGKAGNNGKLKVPSYLGPTMFSQAMTDLIAKGRDAKTDIAKGYETFLAAIPDENHRKHVQKIVGDKVDSVEELQQKLETWFNNSMDRLSGAYKRNTQWFSRGFAIGLVLVLNVNTITMAKVLWNDPEARAAAVKEADDALKRCKTPTTKPGPQPQPQPQPQPGVVGAGSGAATGSGADDPFTPENPTTPPGQPPLTQEQGACPDLITTLGDEIPFPVQGRFWTGAFDSGTAFLTTLFGLLLSIWAVSLGAPFWFDTLRKISGGIQQTGPKPERDGKSDAKK
jgi:hypothetical protein